VNDLTLTSPRYRATQRRKELSGKCSVTCAKTNLPLFIFAPRNALSRRVAKLTVEVQIETRQNRHLFTSSQGLMNPWGFFNRTAL
jgi:hypothetical protein